MERLSYDLVEKILGSLPRKNVEAVAEAVEGCRRLEHWDAAAKDQLENRLLLDVTVSVQQPITNDKNSDPRIDISCRVILHRGGYRAWNFTQWRYAWIRNVYIKTSLYTGRPNDPYTGNADQALRSLSLPVEPSARGSLLYYHGPQFDDNGNDNKLWAGLQVVDLSWKFLQAAQKGFSNVTIHRSKHISCEAFEKFVVDHICQGAVLESLQCLGDCTKSRNILAVVARLFRERRGRPLKLKLHCVHFKQAEVELIIDNWLQSDGAFEEKTISWCGTDGHAINRVKYKQFVRTYSCGYLAHPTRRSSLKITRGTIQVKQFHPWTLVPSTSTVRVFVVGDCLDRCHGRGSNQGLLRLLQRPYLLPNESERRAQESYWRMGN
uniref:F-box domain-containing protein n=1 Tax=Steinernema glaseri TaxID=37863 RepID=A0A1I7YUS4_9BILA